MEHRQTDRAYQAGRAMGDALGSLRRYSVVVTIVEVFFRKNMGVRYFTWRTCLGGLVLLLLIRFAYSYPYVKPELWQYMALKLYRVDVFIGAYLLFSFYHFWQQWHYKEKGKNIHTFDIGDSRFFFIGRWFSSKKYATITYRIIEPLILLLLVIPVLNISVIMGFFTFIAVFRLWWVNSTVLNEIKRRGWNIDDRKIEAGELLVRMRQKQIREQQPVIQPQPKQPIRQRQHQNNSTSSTTPKPSVKDALKNLNPKLKNLGKK